jgi:hypothetical protein
VLDEAFLRRLKGIDVAANLGHVDLGFLAHGVRS